MPQLIGDTGKKTSDDGRILMGLPNPKKAFVEWPPAAVRGFFLAVRSGGLAFRRQ